MKIALQVQAHKMSSIRITPSRLLKLFILLGLTSELPTLSRSRNGRPLDDCWPAGSVSAWSLAPDSERGANETEARDEIKKSASNSSSGGLTEASNVSIVRSGIQSDEAASVSAGSILGEATSLKPQPGPEPRQDSLSQAADAHASASSTSQTGPTNHRLHGAHSNHKNYPNEPYPSAGYTALSVHHAPASSFAASLNSSPGSTRPGAHSLLADREHHNLVDNGAERLQQASLGDQLLTSYASQQLQNPYRSSFVVDAHERTGAQMLADSLRTAPSGSLEESALNEALVALASAPAMPSLTLNHDHHHDQNQHHSASALHFNASLIQNLTAGLFPVNKMSNVTMLSLGELLSKTKQAGNSLNNRPNEFDAFDYAAGKSGGGGGGGGDHQAASAGQDLSTGSQQANYLGALLGDSRLSSMLDFLAHKPSQTSAASSQFGFREPSAVSRYQAHSAAGLLQRDNQQTAHLSPQLPGQNAPAAKEANKFDSAQIVLGTRAQAANQPHLSRPSNVYNTYLPLRDNLKGHNKPMTNGQMLNMAASLYENYLDQNYRYPPMAKQHQQQQQQQNVRNSPGDYSTSNNNQYQFIQQHNSQNQNHLDRIVYHSTPFRPSIVSPPQQQQQQQQSSRMNGTLQANHQSHQRPKGEADIKSMSYAALGTNNQILANTRPQSDFGSNSSRAQQLQQQAKFEPIRQHENDLDSIYDQLNGPQASYKHQTNQTASSNNIQQTRLGLNSSAENKSSGALQASSSSGPQLLLDLYERAIDNQILEAIYSDHQQHFQHLGPSASPARVASLGASQPQTSASMSSPSNWPFDDTLVSSFQTSQPSYSMNSVGRTPSVSGAVALGQQADHYHLMAPTGSRAHGASRALASSGISQSSLVDPLASALQELPTFSAPDLQPLLAGPEANSMLVSPSQLSPSSSALNLNAFPAVGSGQPPGALNSQSPDAPSLGSLAAQLLGPLASSPTPSYNQLFGGGDNEMPTASYMFESRPPSASQAQGQQSPPASNTNAYHHQSGNSNNGNNLGLTALLARLQAGQFSSILTSPFAHLYANLPRYRYPKSKQSGATSRPRGQNNPHQGAGSKLNKQQAAAAAAMAAATAANLIAASGQTLSPLQAAMMQAQEASSAFLNTEALVAEHTTGHSSLLEAAGPQQPSLSQQAASLASSSFMAGLAGGGVSPQVWRHILAPINWSRKQTTASGQPNGPANSSAPSGQQNSHGSQSAAQAGESAALLSSYQHQSGRHSVPLALLNSIWNNNNNNLPFSHLLSASQAQLSSVPFLDAATSANEPHKRPPSRVRIKILKIPVALYDTSPPAGGLLADGSALQNEASAPISSSISLMPVHLQPALTASLLSTLSCPLHARQPQMNPLFANTHLQPPASAPVSIESTPLPAGSLSHSHTASNQRNPYKFNSFSYQHQNRDQVDSPFAGIKQSSPAGRGNSAQSLGGQSTSGSGEAARASADKLAPIRDFTDINQPNDLLVSPSGATGALSTLLSQQQQHQQQFLTKSS